MENPPPRFSGRGWLGIYLLERKLAAPAQWTAFRLAGARAGRPGAGRLQKPLEELLRLHCRHRFDPRGLSGQEREALTREAKICLDALSRTS